MKKKLRICTFFVSCRHSLSDSLEGCEHSRPHEAKWVHIEKEKWCTCDEPCQQQPESDKCLEIEVEK